MSFSYDLKKELSMVEDAPRHCRAAELAAFVLFLSAAEQEKIVFTSSNILTLNAASALMKKLFRVSAEPVLDPQQKKYVLTVSDNAVCEELRRALKCKEEEGVLIPDIRQLLVKSCCRRAFLRGAFLCAGTISDPDRSYHMEINCRTEYQAGIVNALIRSLHIESRLTKRNRYVSVYIKDGDAISDALGLMGARVSLLELENRRIVRSMRGNVNRQVNCETANIEKTANASVRQTEDIRYIYENGGADLLTAELEEAARLRLGHPEATLMELARMPDPPISRSGMNHRLRKLTRIAEQMRNEKGLSH